MKHSEKDINVQQDERVFERIAAMKKSPGETDQIQQISEALRKHRLTLVKTAAGYDVVKLGEITAESQKKSPGQSDQIPSATAGMNMAERILHVGGRNNAAGYVEFGSVQAVEALVRHVIRDLPQPGIKFNEGLHHEREARLAAEPQKKSPERIDQTRRTGAAALAPPGYFKAEQQDPAVSVTYKEVMDVMNTLYAGNIKQVQIAVAMGEKKLYTSPPQRTWVGLTVAEMEELTLLVGRMDYTRMLQLAEAKLKEKNT